MSECRRASGGNERAEPSSSGRGAIPLRARCKFVLSLVGVPAEQVLHRYVQGRGGTDISALSDDMLANVLFVAGGMIASTLPDSNCHRFVDLTGDGCLKRVLVCRLVSSRWRKLSARPLMAAALLSGSGQLFTKSMGFAAFLEEKLASPINSRVARPPAFLVRLYENGMTGGLRASPTDPAPMHLVAAYYTELFREGIMKPGLVICLASQVRAWSLIQPAAAVGPDVTFRAVVYSGDAEHRMGLMMEAKRRAQLSSERTIFIATFATINSEYDAVEQQSESDFGDDAAPPAVPCVMSTVASFVADERRAPSGVLLGCNLYERLQQGSASNRGFGFHPGNHSIRIRPMPSPSGFDDLFRFVSTMFPAIFNLQAKEALLDVADRFSFGDEALAQWGVESFAAPLLGKMASVGLREC